MAYHQTAVADHLRVCAHISDNRIWVGTLYLSEPVLSCVASQILHAHPDNAKLSLERLKDEMTNGLIDMDKVEGLVSRIILLIAKDLCARQVLFQPTQAHRGKWDEELLDCRPLPVVQYLEFLFGGDRLDDSMKEPLRDWYINFSHWISIRENIKAGSNGELGYVSFVCLWTFNLINGYPQIG